MRKNRRGTTERNTQIVRQVFALQSQFRRQARQNEVEVQLSDDTHVKRRQSILLLEK